MTEILKEFLTDLPATLWEVAQVFLPLIVVFFIFQFTVLKLRKRELLKIFIGLLYTYTGLVLFLVGIHVGFMPAGSELGGAIANKSSALFITAGFALGFVVVMAEPAVQVLNNQVYTVSGGRISKRAMLLSLSIGVGVAIALAMVRIVFNFSIWWYIVPGYLLSFVLMKFTPNVFTAIAFDSGGVASGPMTATFILAFAIGAAKTLHGENIMSLSFGTVAMVALTPLIAIQIMGVIYDRNHRRIKDEFSEMQKIMEEADNEIEIYNDTVGELIVETSPHDAEEDQQIPNEEHDENYIGEDKASNTKEGELI